MKSSASSRPASWNTFLWPERRERPSRASKRVHAELKRGTAALLLRARDGSERQFAKLGTQVCNIECCGCLSSAELGMAFARGNVIYAALKVGALGSKTIEATKRLADYRE